VDDRNGLEWDADPGKFEHDLAAGTITECGNAIRFNTGLREKNIKRGTADSLHAFYIGQNGHDAGQHRIRSIEEYLTTVIIHRKRQVAMRGKIVSPMTLILFETNAIMSY